MEQKNRNMKLVKSMINKRMVEQIVADLTIGRDDNELPEFTQEQIDITIAHYEPKIIIATNNMYDAYNEDNTLHDLIKPEADWFREFLYEVIPSDHFLSEFGINN